MPKGGEQVAGGGGISQHYGPRGRSGLQLPILVRGRPPCVSTMCVEETLQQSFVSYVAVWTECHAAASVRRRVRARLVPAAEDSYEEREIC